MKRVGPIEQRLDELTTTDELLVAALRAHKAGGDPSLSPGAMARIARMLGQRRSRARRPFVRIVRAVAIVAAMLVAVKAGAFAGAHVLKALAERVASRAHEITRPRAVGSWPLPTLAPVPEIAPAPPERAVVHHSRVHATFPPREPVPVVASAPTPAEPPRLVPPVEVPPPAPQIPPVVVPEPPKVPPPAPAPDPVALEAAEVERAMQQKNAGDLVGAAATLEQYRRAHPQGVFRREAALVELDVELSLGHDREARAVLDLLGDDPTLPRAAELRLLRGELEMRADHCGEALPVFDHVIANDASLAGRALYGRAVCLERLSRIDESRRDFEAYLARYPDGAFAKDARRALEGSR